LFGCSKASIITQQPEEEIVMWLGSAGGSILLVLSILAASLAATAQPAVHVPRIGLLHSGSPATSQSHSDAFRQGLRDLGYLEGQNIVLEDRWAGGNPERLPALAAELVRLPVDVIVTGGTVGVQAAKHATTTIPIVAGGAGDLVGSGLVASLARPGENITGLTDISPELTGKQVELLKEVVPGISRVAFLYAAGTDSQITAHHVQEAQAAAHTLAIQLQPVEVREAQALPSAFAAMTNQGAEALVTVLSFFTLHHRRQLVELAAQSHLPTMYQGREFIEVGGLLSYGTDRIDQWRRAATYTDKILKGAKPANLPVEQPIKFELVINLKTAKALGMTIPPTLLFRADEVIQ
jgi:putative tryptophan/tyrosine transport system substrate-binding protein